MTSRSARRAARLGAALALAFLVQAAAAQPPKDAPKAPPKDAAKDKGKEVNPDEQKAKEEFFKTGKIDEALKSLEAIAKTSPWMSPRAIVAQWCLEGQNGQQARAQLELAAKEDPAHPSVLLVNADFALREGRVTDTILSCTAALVAAEKPRWDADAKKRFQREARLGLLAAFEARGDFISAKEHLTALLAADPKNAPLRQRLARANFLQSLPDAAFTDLQTAFKDDPTLDPPELSMALWWSQKKEFPKAEEWFGKATAAHKDSARVHRGYASYLLDRGRIPAAKDHLEVAKKNDPTSLDTRLLSGMFARYSKDYATATQVFEELVRQHPSFGPAIFNLALVLAESGDANDKRRATELAQTFYQQNQRSSDGLALLAYSLHKAGRAADAEKAARALLGAGQVNLNLDAAYFIARVLADRGANEDAHKLIKAAVESKEWFLYRKDAEALFADLDKKVTPPKK